jgi:hypothetical protein
MFFTRCRDAGVYARLEYIRTGIIHIVKPCKKYFCPPKEYFNRDWVNGFTVVIQIGAIKGE